MLGWPVVSYLLHASCSSPAHPACLHSEKSVKAFTQNLVGGKLTPEYKSAAIPDEPTDGGVTVVVGKNFDSVVKDSKKDVLLEVRGSCVLDKCCGVCGCRGWCLAPM